MRLELQTVALTSEEFDTTQQLVMHHKCASPFGRALICENMATILENRLPEMKKDEVLITVVDIPEITESAPPDKSRVEGAYRLSIKGNHICSIYVDKVESLYDCKLFQHKGDTVIVLDDRVAEREGITITEG